MSFVLRLVGLGVWVFGLFFWVGWVVGFGVFVLCVDFLVWVCCFVVLVF